MARVSDKSRGSEGGDVSGKSDENGGATRGENIIDASRDVAGTSAQSGDRGESPQDGGASAIAEEPTPTPKKRGRKPGSKNANPTSPQAILNADTLAKQIQGLHVCLSAITRQPILLLAPEECALLANSICDVAKHYDLPVTQKTLAWTNLLASIGMVYGMRIMAVYFPHVAGQQTNETVQDDMFVDQNPPNVVQFNN